MKNRKYKIILEKGEAQRSFFELTEIERQEVGKKIFERARLQAARIGKEPVTIQTLTKRKQKSLPHN